MMTASMIGMGWMAIVFWVVIILLIGALLKYLLGGKQ